MDKNYLVHFDNGSFVEITEAELNGIGHNLDAGNTQNFQWIKRPEGMLIIPLDKVILIEPKRTIVDAVVKPPTPDTIRKEQEKDRIASISSADAVLERLNETNK